MITFHAVGRWDPGHVRLGWIEQSSRRLVPEVEQIIEETWTRAASTPGVHLFDGPMCRMESVDLVDDTLTLALSPTSYKLFLGTNLHNPQLARKFGRCVMANPLGVSALLETADGFLMLGQRNSSVAYYPDRVHPFAGTLEPRDGADAFAAVYRELKEELALTRDHISDVRCTGLIEDAAILQPELIFTARCDLTRVEVDQHLDPTEHRATWAVPVQPDAIESAVRDPALTPVAVGSLLLWGRSRIGSQWFERVRLGICP
jgi:8-oxo-dGTP pyrophosphatase MutT (NUDIX family)